ncbi:MAG: response regulator transcription factor [Egibacteraceae bacterium]
MNETGTTEAQSEAQPVPPFRPNLDIITTMERSEPLNLIRQERQIAGLVAQGKTNREIAAGLTLSSWTMQARISRLCAKLGVSSRAELAAVLWGGGLAEQGERPDETGHGNG